MRKKIVRFHEKKVYRRCYINVNFFFVYNVEIIMIQSFKCKPLEIVKDNEEFAISINENPKAFFFLFAQFKSVAFHFIGVEFKFFRLN